MIIDDASEGTIYHYGSAGALNIIQCHTGSYHENGKVAYAEIAKGRIVLEKGADVEEIHINKKTDSSFDTVIIANKGGAEELPERITRDAVTVSSETLVVTVESNGSSEDVYVYANGEIGSTQQVTEGPNKQNEDVNSDLGQLVLDNGSGGEKAQTADQKEAAKTEAINHLVEKEEASEERQVLITKEGKASTWMTLSAFRDSVNSGNSYEGYLVSLKTNVDLKGIEWTPIGINGYPFSGIFDGENYRISNFVINTPSNSKAGLFGTLTGKQNTAYNVTVNPDKTVNKASLLTIWKNDQLVESNIEESKYTAIIKNLTVSGCTINNTSNDGSSRYSGAVVGIVNHGYLSNLTVINSNISGTKGVGGITGALDGGVAIYCVIDSSVNVNASVYNVGGIAGGTNYASSNRCVAIVNCTNNGTITSGSYNAAGMVGLGQSPNCTVFVNCTNNGTIIGTITSTEDGIGGIVANGIYSAVLSRCTNNGQIINKGTVGLVGGIMASGCAMCYDCVNNADIKVSANYLSGIYNYNASNNIYDNLAVGCYNNGTLTNTKDNGQVYEINSISGINVYKNVSYNSISEVNTAISQNGNTTTRFVDCTFNYNLEGTTAILTSNIQTIYSNTQFAEFIDYSTGNSKYICVDVPNVIIKNGSGDTNIYEGSICTYGTNSKLIIATDDSVTNVKVQDASAEISGSITNLTLLGTSANVELKENAEVSLVRFGGTGTYTLTNRGTISHTQSDDNLHVNEHTVSTIKACNITINNYGSIESKKNSSNVCSYAMLFYNGCSVVVNQYYGSSITAESPNNGYLLACSTANSVVYKTFNEQGNLVNTIVKK